MVQHATELRLGIDYIETRDDVDAGRLAYVAVSFGAGSRLAFSAVDDRYKSVVYVGGGIDERMKPTLPEADNVNFAPYISVPKLLINGRSDEEHPWYTRGLPLWNLLAEPKELVLVDGGGHVVPLEERIPAINDFLDRTLGPVGGR
jgi:pimeloyl-ACP methyl ester carboxylesterase